VQGLVCGRKVMPHAQRTNDLFWQSLNPNMPAYLQIYGQALPAWAASNDLQCGQFFQGGGDAQSVFTGDIYPIMATNCGGCHDVVGLANFNIGGTAATYNQLLTANTKPGAGNPHYIVPNSTGTSWLYHRITTGNQISFPKRMPQGGPDLVATDTNSNGVFDAADFSTWINSGAPGP
jgi:hypothetical protein